MLFRSERVPESYNAGFSMYVAAWPLLKSYPGSRFQSGLFGTWMFAQFEGKAPEKLYSDIEGGLGWWRDTRFATETPKFIMGGVAPNFIEWANGPGAGKGRDWDKPAGKYAVAQLSPTANKKQIVFDIMSPPPKSRPRDVSCCLFFFENLRLA